MPLARAPRRRRRPPWRSHRTPAALASIEAIASEVPEAAVGAGTLRVPADAKRTKDAGATFAVSPATQISARRRDADLPLLPGVVTASER